MEISFFFSSLLFGCVMYHLAIMDSWSSIFCSSKIKKHSCVLSNNKSMDFFFHKRCYCAMNQHLDSMEFQHDHVHLYGWPNTIVKLLCLFKVDYPHCICLKYVHVCMCMYVYIGKMFFHFCLKWAGTEEGCSSWWWSIGMPYVTLLISKGLQCSSIWAISTNPIIFPSRWWRGWYPSCLTFYLILSFPSMLIFRDKCTCKS